MCGLYPQRSAYMSYLVHMSVYLFVRTCIDFTSTPTLGGCVVKAYFIIVEPNLTRNLGLLVILGFTILLLCRGINP